jgi:ribosome biogenesis GTPase / thiamine phosphate phosphatase
MWRARGGWVIDTPGLREIQMLDHGEGFDQAFADIHSLSERCKFGDCAHNTEPGCAIKAALQSGALDPARWQSFLKLQRNCLSVAQNRSGRGGRGAQEVEAHSSRKSPTRSGERKTLELCSRPTAISDVCARGGALVALFLVSQRRRSHGTHDK